MKGRILIFGSCVLFSSLLPASIASALTRDEIIATAVLYRDLSYDVDSINVYPWNHHEGDTCYSESCRNTVPLGWRTGMAYSYGNWHTPQEFLSRLEDSCGAGNGPCMNYSCFYNHMTGIDCSGLVGRAWGITGTKPSTWHLFNDYSTAIDTGAALDITDLRKGDILDRTTSPAHVMLFNYWDSPFPLAWVIHSNLTDGRVANDRVDVRGYIRQDGYKLRVSNDIQDAPVASLLWIGSDSTGTIEWETGWEKETAGFVVHRLLPDGTAKPISDLIPGRGSVEKGDRYSFLDGSYPGPQTIYRLQEIETSGNTIWLGKTSAADGIPEVQVMPPGVSRIPGILDESERGTPDCQIQSRPENHNLEWIAICPSAWRSSLEPLRAYRESSGFAAGIWDLEEMYECCEQGTAGRECVREYLAWALAEWTVKPKYLLLVGDAYYQGGDADLIPMWASYEPELAWFDEDSTWSDLPYADPDEDGDIEIFVGRIPAMNETDVANAVSKIIERDESADPSYGKRSLLFVEDSGDCGNDSAWIRAMADSVSASIPDDWDHVEIAQSDIGGTYAEWEHVADSAWSAGQGFVLFFGNCSGWWDFNNFMNVGGGWQSGMLDANHMFPFVFGGSCGEGGLDRENYYGRAVMEQLLCSHADRGASGGLLPSRAVHPHTAMQLANHLVARIVRGEPTLGSATYHGMEDLLEAFPGAADHVWEYVFFGDPAMRSLAADVTEVAEETAIERLAFGLNTPAPHPFSAHGGAIRFSLPGPADIDLEIYDVAGRMVKILASGRWAGGRHVVDWDGCNARGRQVASGVYFVRLRSGDREIARKVTLLR